MALKIGPVAPSHCCSPPGLPFQLLPNFHSMVNFVLNNTWLSPSHGFSLSTTTAWSPGSCHAFRSNLLKTSKYRNDKQLWSRPHRGVFYISSQKLLTSSRSTFLLSRSIALLTKIPLIVAHVTWFFSFSSHSHFLYFHWTLDVNWGINSWLLWASLLRILSLLFRVNSLQTLLNDLRNKTLVLLAGRVTFAHFFSCPITTLGFLPNFERCLKRHFLKKRTQ